MAQAYAGLDSNRAVGVMGDARVYGKLSPGMSHGWPNTNPSKPGYIIILRAVCSVNFMTAEPYEFDFKLLTKIARRIVNEVDGVSRVTYDITSKPPGMYLESLISSSC